MVFVVSTFSFPPPLRNNSKKCSLPDYQFFWKAALFSFPKFLMQKVLTHPW